MCEAKKSEAKKGEQQMWSDDGTALAVTCFQTWGRIYPLTLISLLFTPGQSSSLRELTPPNFWDIPALFSLSREATLCILGVLGWVWKWCGEPETLSTCGWLVSIDSPAQWLRLNWAVIVRRRLGLKEFGEAREIWTLKQT